MDQAGLFNMKEVNSFKTSEITHQNTTSPPHDLNRRLQGSEKVSLAVYLSSKGL